MTLQSRYKKGHGIRMYKNPTYNKKVYACAQRAVIETQKSKPVVLLSSPRFLSRCDRLTKSRFYLNPCFIRSPRLSSPLYTSVSRFIRIFIYFLLHFLCPGLYHFVGFFRKNLTEPGLVVLHHNASYIDPAAGHVRTKRAFGRANL